MSKLVNNHRTFNLSRSQGFREVKQSFLIICEGARTEPDYFKAFRMTSATVKVVGQAMNTTSLVAKAINIRDMEERKGHTYDQSWVVFDKDDFPVNEFNRAIVTAQNRGFRVAYSNQAFEYWFLLHFNLYVGPLHRDKYASMLTKLCGFPYSKHEGFGAVMYNRLHALQSKAIHNAQLVMKDISRGNPAMEESSTTVYQLVEELNKYF